MNFKTELHLRTKKCLLKIGINNDNELQKYLLYHYIEYLMIYRNFGRKSLKNLIDYCIDNHIKYYHQ